MTDKELIERAKAEQHTYERVSGRISAELIERLETLSDAAGKLASALEPFAEACCHLHPAHPEDGETLDGFMVADFRRAASALQAWEQVRG